MFYRIEGGTEFMEINKQNNSDVVKATPIQQVNILYRRDLYPELLDLECYGNFVDLRCAETVELKKGELTKIPLGVCIELPQGYWGQLVPRSSSPEKFGFIQANSFGVIDTSYCGKNDIWALPVLPIRDGVVNVNDRICQFRIVKDNPFYLNEIDIDHWNKEDRGGFGSTGRK